MANKLSQTVRLAREKEIARMARMGMTSEQIGSRLGLSGSSILKTLAKLRDDWKQSINRDVSDLQARQAAEIVDLKERAMEGWDKSLKAKTKKSTKKKGKVAGESITPNFAEQSSVIEETNGDPRFLMVYTKLMEREANLLGMDAPKRIIDESGGKVGLKIDLSKLTDEQLEALASAVGGVEGN